MSLEHLSSLINKYTKPIQILTEHENKNCPICLDNFYSDNLNKSKDVCCLGCKHYFHSECIGLWLNKNRSCPLCREKCIEYNCDLDSFVDILNESNCNTNLTNTHNNFALRDNPTLGVFDIYYYDNPEQIEWRISYQDVEIVMMQTRSSKDRAIRALIQYNLNIVEAIMAIIDDDISYD